MFHHKFSNNMTNLKLNGSNVDVNAKVPSTVPTYLNKDIKAKTLLSFTPSNKKYPYSDADTKFKNDIRKNTNDNMNKNMNENNNFLFSDSNMIKINPNLQEVLIDVVGFQAFKTFYRKDSLDYKDLAVFAFSDWLYIAFAREKAESFLKSLNITSIPMMERLVTSLMNALQYMLIAKYIFKSEGSMMELWVNGLVGSLSSDLVYVLTGYESVL